MNFNVHAVGSTRELPLDRSRPVLTTNLRMINREILDQVHQSGAQLVAVTKYLSSDALVSLQDDLTAHPAVYGLGENRTEALKSKEIAREYCHYIGRLQSRKLKDIVTHCSVIHSLASLKHARLIDQQGMTTQCFVQVNVGEDPAKAGISPEELPGFLSEVKTMRNCEVIGLSTMGWGTFTPELKRQEFRDLIALRDQYLPNGKTSAGTSQDYEIALKAGIDIVRVGSALFSL